MNIHNFQPKFSITNSITSALTQIERARGFLEAAKLSEDWIQRISEEVLIREAHHTTHIEGTHLTLDQSERLWAGENIPEADPDEVRELLNYRKAFDFISEYLDSGAPITEGLIREIHKHLVEGVRGGAAAPGEYRKVPNYIINSVTGETIYTPPPAHDVPIMMAEMVDWLNQEKEIHPVLMSGIGQFQLVHIHPFLDGNGRTSRLLSTLYLYRSGYDFKRLFTISEFYDRDREAFYKAIQSVRKNDMDMTTWLEYFVEGLKTQMTETKTRSEIAAQADLMAKKYSLSLRQTSALDYMMKHKEMSIQNYENLWPDVNRRTLQRDLREMADKGLLETKGATNRLIYIIVKTKR